MANKKYHTLSEEAVDKLCGLIRESHSVSEGINDNSVATNSTFSSKKIKEMLGEIDGTEIKERVEKNETDILSVSEKVDKKIPIESTITRTLTADDFVGGYITEGNEIRDTSSYPTRMYTPEYLECTYDNPFYVNGDGTNKWCFRLYDSNKELLKAGQFSASGKGDVVKIAALTEDSDVAYVRFCIECADGTDVSTLPSKFTISRTWEENTLAQFKSEIIHYVDEKFMNVLPESDCCCEKVTETITRTLTADDLANGYINNSDKVYGGTIAYNYRAYTPEYLECTKDRAYTVICDDQVKVAIRYYNASKTLIGTTDFIYLNKDTDIVIGKISGNSLCSVQDDVAYVRLCFAYRTENTSEAVDIDILISHYTISRTWEETKTNIAGIDVSQIVVKQELEKVVDELENTQQKGSCVVERYDSNFIPNERFIRGISNVRDETTSKEFEIHIANNSGKIIKNAGIVVGLHNTVGIIPENNNLPFQIYDDVFTNDVGFKFFDENAKELPYYIESENNCNYIVDKNIKNDQKTMAVFSDGKIAVYNSESHRIQISADDGVTWTNICEEITAWPYRILLPDSQDNLFVADSTGYKLYKYTSADGYMTGKLVLDMTSYNTQIGSILAEDSDGNLYLGTYQNPTVNERSTIRKSTDHGETWEIVFDRAYTDEEKESIATQHHVHNIFVNKKVIPNEIFIGLDSLQQKNETYVSTDAGATWTLVPCPYGNHDYAFRYAGENFYIGCGENIYLGGCSLYKTTDYNDPNAYYPLFDNGGSLRDVINVIEGSDDVLLAGGCVDEAVPQQQLYLSEDRGETWKTVLKNPYPKFAESGLAGEGLRTFSRKGNEILSETSTNYPMRFVYGNGAKTILSIVSVGDIPTTGKTITLKTGYVANIEQMHKVLTSYEDIEGKVADINIRDGYVVDKVSNKRVMTNETEIVNARIKVGQTSEYKILANSAYRLNGSVNLGKLSRLNFTKGFTVSLIFRRESGKTLEEYLRDSTNRVIFQTGSTKLVMRYKNIILMQNDTDIHKMIVNNVHFLSTNADYIRVTFYVTNETSPKANIYTENMPKVESTINSYPITQKFSVNDFIVGDNNRNDNITRIEIYNRVLSHGEIMSLTNGCNLVTDKSEYN